MVIEEGVIVVVVDENEEEDVEDGRCCAAMWSGWSGERGMFVLELSPTPSASLHSNVVSSVR